MTIADCGGSILTTDPLAAAPKAIIDSDFNTMGDDGQLFAMTKQLMGEGKVSLPGLCVVTGNDWLTQEQADALKAVERMGVQGVVGVYVGADYPSNTI
jgi:purine nucleosidase